MKVVFVHQSSGLVASTGEIANKNKYEEGKLYNGNVVARISSTTIDDSVIVSTWHWDFTLKQFATHEPRISNDYIWSIESSSYIKNPELPDNIENIRVLDSRKAQLDFDLKNDKGKDLSFNENLFPMRTENRVFLYDAMVFLLNGGKLPAGYKLADASGVLVSVSEQDLKDLHSQLFLRDLGDDDACLLKKSNAEKLPLSSPTFLADLSAIIPERKIP